MFKLRKLEKQGHTTVGQAMCLPVYGFENGTLNRGLGRVPYNVTTIAIYEISQGRWLGCGSGHVSIRT